LFVTEILAERFRELHRVRALLKTNDDTIAQRPNVRETGFESSAAIFRARRIEAQADDVVACLKNLRWFGAPTFKITEQACEEIRRTRRQMARSVKSNWRLR